MSPISVLAHNKFKSIHKMQTNPIGFFALLRKYHLCKQNSFKPKYKYDLILAFLRCF